MTRQIFAAEITFQDSPPSVCENFNASEKNVKRLLAALKTVGEEVFIVATRHRFSAYVVHDDIFPLRCFLERDQSLKGCLQYYHNTGKSVTHLMATAAGLLSPIKGDITILDEIRRCHAWAVEMNTLGIILNNTVNRALETGRTVRTKTGIDKFCASVVETGLDLLYSHLDNIHSRNFLVIGTGHLSSLALRYLAGEGIRTVVLTGTDAKQVTSLAKKYHVHTAAYAELARHIIKADIVIAASHQEVTLRLSAEERKRFERNRDRFILDLGMPPNFTDSWIEECTESFYNLDDLRRAEASPLDPFGGLEEAWRRVMRASSEFVKVLHWFHQSPVLTTYLNRQFSAPKDDGKTRPWRLLRTMLFRRQENTASISPTTGYRDEKLHLGNYLPENPSDAVKNVGHVSDFNFYLWDN